MTKTKTKVTYYANFRCVACHKSLTVEERRYTDGMCPACGHIGEQATTIVATYRVKIRKTQINPAWKFWLPTYALQQVNKEKTNDKN